MPVATVNEDHFSSSHEDEVGSSGQTATMQSVTIAECMHQPPNTEFRLRVLRSDALHVLPALRR